MCSLQNDRWHAWEHLSDAFSCSSRFRQSSSHDDPLKCNRLLVRKMHFRQGVGCKITSIRHFRTEVWRRKSEERVGVERCAGRLRVQDRRPGSRLLPGQAFCPAAPEGDSKNSLIHFCFAFWAVIADVSAFILYSFWKSCHGSQ